MSSLVLRDTCGVTRLLVMEADMTVREFAVMEGISLGQVYRRLWEGRLCATKIDGRWLITPAAKNHETAETREVEAGN
jgi:hypothetical protein